MNGFLEIKRIIVPRSAADEANLHLREMGRRGLEGFSLWAGTVSGSSFLVRANIVPAQTGYQLPSGVCIAIGPEELHRLNVWLYEHEMKVIAQLHSHPTDAYHSDTDDTYPIAATIGCISIVIPDFAREPFSLARCAIYRLNSNLKWRGLRSQEVSELIQIVDQ
jgi:hypothetical protein